jgi:hypothetical protein
MKDEARMRARKCNAKVYETTDLTSIGSENFDIFPNANLNLNFYFYNEYCEVYCDV